ncbi:MAG: hypothetical protein NZ853_10670 [Leptospiraceae bacterium]|nr:hypothetical protein [Leptospiraceae bacterium]MDW7977084.1 hypothetical protein [Leptospiraceae bacterium]
MKILRDVEIKSKTSMGLGNKVPFWVEISDEEELKQALDFLKEKKLGFFVLGEGTNTIGSDEVLPIGILHLKNHQAKFQVEDKVLEIPFDEEKPYQEFYPIKFYPELLKLVQLAKEKHKSVQIWVDSGIRWDNFVFFCLMHSIPSFVLLSGIPGKVGALPIQNVGAYGDEIQNYVKSVITYEIENYEPKKKKFVREDCDFRYRSSIFKKFPLRFVVFQLELEVDVLKPIPLHYQELRNSLLFKTEISAKEKEKEFFDSFFDSNLKNEILFPYQIRKTIYEIRRKKGMILDEQGPDRHTAGSFFLNPLLSKKEFQDLQSKIPYEIPHYIEDSYYKVPAAWLIEYSGFFKGYKSQNQTLGISPHHALAIINYHANVKELKAFVKGIQNQVYQKTGIRLQTEPVFMDEVILQNSSFLIS